MKFKKSMLALAAAATMTAAMVGAAGPQETITVGVVNINAVAEKMPAFPAYVKQAEAIEAKYAPQLTQANKEMQAAKTDAERAAIQKKYAPVAEAMGKEEEAASATLSKQITEALENLRKANKYQAILPVPGIPPTATFVDATQAAINAK